MIADQHAEDPQSWNLYNYVRNAPLNALDPTGTAAVWIVDKKTGEKTLVIPVHITGQGATPGAVKGIVSRDNQLDTSGSQVKIKVIGTDKPLNGVLNQMDFNPGYNTKNFGPAGEGTN